LSCGGRSFLCGRDVADEHFGVVLPSFAKADYANWIRV
jgi:hypothetical protein